DGRTIATAGSGDLVRLWDAATGRPRLKIDHRGGFQFSPDGRELISGGWYDGTVRSWDAATGRAVRSFEVTDGESGRRSVRTIALSPDGRTLAVEGVNNRLRLCDPRTGRVRSTLEGDYEGVLRLAFSPDGRRLASAHFDRSVRIWDVAS